ncbi:MAG: helix-turn-helix transcriptional regulator [Defluviitaleaceae bacterium]|nr:helix-turn-helix transcriptional regulator [Defluviitaleaceae bacterium]
MESQRIKKKRKHLGMSQYELAEAILSNQARISRIEKGLDSYTKEEIMILKKLLGIEGMPLTDFEFESFKETLHYWLGFIRAGRMDEASKLREELSVVINIEPYDEELPTLFRLFEVSYLLVEGNLEDAEEKLEIVEQSLRTMNEECLFYYNSRMGSLHAMRRDPEKALSYYEKAFKISEQSKDFFPRDIEILYYNIAMCYLDLEVTSRTIVFLNKIRRKRSEDNRTNHSLGVDLVLAITYYKIGMYDEAEKILNNCHTRAYGTGNKLFTGLSLYHLGIIHKFLKKWKKAIEYFNEALDTFEENTHYHAWALYNKIRCKVEVDKLFDLERELNEIELSLEGKENYSIFLKSLKHIIHLNRNITLYNSKAAEYIENTTIPYLVKNSNRLEALDLYRLLIRHFERTSKQKKTSEARKAMLEIYERMV